MANGSSLGSVLTSVPIGKAFMALFVVIWTLISVVVTFLLWDRNEFQKTLQTTDQRVQELERWRVATDETRYRPADALHDQRRAEERTSAMIEAIRNEFKTGIAEIREDIKELREKIQ